MRPEIILYFFVQKRCSVRAGIVIARLSGLASANRVRYDCTNTIGVKYLRSWRRGDVTVILVKIIDGRRYRNEILNLAQQRPEHLDTGFSTVRTCNSEIRLTFRKRNPVNPSLGKNYPRLRDFQPPSHRSTIDPEDDPSYESSTEPTRSSTAKSSSCSAETATDITYHVSYATDGAGSTIFSVVLVSNHRLHSLWDSRHVYYGYGISLLHVWRLLELQCPS